MKIIQLFIFLLLTVMSCNTKNNEYIFEDKLYDCFIEHNKDINVEKSIKKLEQKFIKYKILDDSKGKSYIDFFNRLKNIENFSLLISNNLKDEIKSIENLPTSIICLDTSLLLDTIAARNSRLAAMADVMDEIIIAGDINNMSIANATLKHIREKDFDHKLYKSIFLIGLANLILNPGIINGTVIERKLPPISNAHSKPTEIHKRNIMVVLINSKNEVFIDNQKVQTERINKTVKDFFLNPDNNLELPEKKEINLPKIGKIKVSKGIISFQTDRNTSYELYIQVQNELVRAINELRDDFSIKRFNKNFDDLTDEDKDIVSKVYPLCISEDE